MRAPTVWHNGKRYAVTVVAGQVYIDGYHADTYPERLRLDAVEAAREGRV